MRTGSPAPRPFSTAAPGVVSGAGASLLLVLAAAVVAGAALWLGGVTSAAQTVIAALGIGLAAVVAVISTARGAGPRLGAARGWFLALAAFAALQAVAWPEGFGRLAAPYAASSRGLGPTGAGDTVRWSLDAGPSWRGAILIAGCVFFSYAVCALARGRGALLLRLLTAVLLGHSILGLAFGRYWDGDRVLGVFEAANPYTAFGSFHSQSQFGSFVVVLVGAPLALWRVRRGIFDRALAAAAITAATAAIFRSESRAGLAGLLLAFAAAWVASAPPGRRAKRFQLAALGVALLFAARIAGVSALVQAFPARVDESLRYQIWKGTVDLALQQPLVGTGFGSFPYAYAGGGRPDLGMWITIGENEFLHTAAEAGLAGLVLLFGGAWATISGFRRRLAAGTRKSPWIALAGFAGLLPAVMTAVPLHTPAVLLAAIAVFAAASALAEEPR